MSKRRFIEEIMIPMDTKADNFKALFLTVDGIHKGVVTVALGPDFKPTINIPKSVQDAFNVVLEGAKK